MAESEKKEHKHDYKMVPKGPSNFNIRISGNQRWFACARPGCSSMTLRPLKKRKSKFRREK